MGPGSRAEGRGGAEHPFRWARPVPVVKSPPTEWLYARPFIISRPQATQPRPSRRQSQARQVPAPHGALEAPTAQPVAWCLNADSCGAGLRSPFLAGCQLEPPELLEDGLGPGTWPRRHRSSPVDPPDLPPLISPAASPTAAGGTALLSGFQWCLRATPPALPVQGAEPQRPTQVCV